MPYVNIFFSPRVPLRSLMVLSYRTVVNIIGEDLSIESGL